MWGNGCNSRKVMARSKALEWSLPVIIVIKGSFMIIRSQELELLSFIMGMFMKASGRTAKWMGKEYILKKPTQFTTKASGTKDN